MTRPLPTRFASLAFVVAAAVVAGGMVPRVADRFAAVPTPAVAAEVDACAGAIYPYLPAECLTSADGSPVPEVRWITIETRIGDNESALTTRPVLVD